MAGTAYHMEALRKTRAIERKTEAMKRLRDSVGQQTYNPSGSGDTDGAPLVFSEPGHYAQNRLTYYKTGREREQRQYDHSRNGPVVDKSNYALRREFNFLGNSLSMLKADIVPAHKPIPVCRRY
ncbi:uncharacterized protein LOC128225142 isoform X2 [Mya arenaria]|uniref:uncharacterized protein LOC128207638 isoform X2 n=1 Tax=Mya arenaria TaxID=6604 RepID=UPI0022E0ED5E|nr:uncharacterized protein LOC128207638 isoform X2 [Mya arenaria]XP_052791144.1 uncharacterized protein LOC128225142 isoform X2 [Mya arenaria]